MNLNTLAELSNAGLGRSNFRLDTSNKNSLIVNQGNKGGLLTNLLLPFCCGWLSLTKVNLCIFEGWSNAGLGRSSFRYLGQKNVEDLSGEKKMLVCLKTFPFFIAVDGG